MGPPLGGGLPPSSIALTFRASPFHFPRAMTAPAGVNLCDMMDAAGIPRAVWPMATVYVGDILVPWESWLHVRPHAGVPVYVGITPRGTGGASIIPASTVRLLLSVGVQAGALLIPGAIGLSGAAATLAGAAINVTGLLAVNALVPPPPVTPEETGYDITGSRNEIRPMEAYPIVWGRHIVYPPHSAVPFTEVDGNDQIFVMRMTVSLGVCDISEIKIGQTIVEGFEGIQTQWTSGRPGKLEQISLYTRDVFPEANLPLDPMGYAPYFDAPLNNDDGLAQGALHPNVIRRTTAADTDEVVIDFQFDNGLIRTSDTGVSPWRVLFEVRMRQVGSVTWQTVPAFSETEISEAAQDITGTRIYQWLSDLHDRLESLIEDIALFSGSREAVPAMLDFLNRMLENTLDRLNGTTGGDAGQNTILANLRTRIAEALQQLATFANGAIDNAAQTLLDQLIQQGNLISDVLIVNQYLNQGYGPALHTLPELARILILSQGLEDIFGYPHDGQWQILDKRAGVVRRTRRFVVPTGQYDVDIRRAQDTNEDSPNIYDDVRIANFKSIRNTAPVTVSPYLSEVALKGRSTSQFYSLIDQLNCIGQQNYFVWDGVSTTAAYGSSGWTLTPTSNPAWAFCFALMGVVNARPFDVSRVDLETILDWADFCDDPAGDGSLKPYRFDMVQTRDMALDDLLDVICHAGRASKYKKHGQYSVIIDRAQAASTNLYTPRNTRDFSISRQMKGAPHAVVVECPNPDAGWNLYEFIAYDDGYSENGGTITDPFGNQVDTVPATDIESVRPVGMIDSHQKTLSDGSANPWYTGQAWRYGRRIIAEARLRREVVEFTTGINHVRNVRGDRIKCQHYVPLWGQNAARVRSVTRSGGTGPITHLGVDVEIVAEAATDYQCQVRTAKGNVVTLGLALTAGNHFTLTLDSSHDDTGDVIQKGDLIAVGVVDLVTEDLVITKIESLPNREARISCVHYDTGVYTSETGTIPEFDTNVTYPPERNLPRPTAPVIISVATDETVLKRGIDGSLNASIYLQLAPVQFVGPDPVSAVEVQFIEEADSAAFGSYTLIGRSAPQPAQQFSDSLTDIFVGPVEDQRTYTIKVRFLTRGGVTSNFTTRSGIYVIGKSTPPPDVVSLYRENEYIVWLYDRPPLDLKGFVVRHVSGTAQNWDNASPAHQGVISGTRFNIAQFLDGGPRVIMVKAIDTAGNVSESEARLVLNLGDPIIDNALAETDHHADGFPGEIDGGTVDGGSGDLEADSGTSKFWGSDAALFWQSDAALFWQQGYSQLRYSFSYTPDAADLPSLLKLEFEVTGPAYRVLYRTDVDAELWPDNLGEDIWPDDMAENFWPTGYIYRAWPGAIAAEAKAYEFRVEIDAGNTQGIISALRVIVDPPDLIEKINSQAIDSAGTRLAITKTFRAIKAVNLTLEDDGGDARTARVLDRDETLGPLVKCYDASFVAADGVVDAVVIGY